MDQMLYFDVNATAPPLPEVEPVYNDAVREHWHNPSSPYGRGARVHILLDTLRQDLAKMLGCGEAQLIFNSGATEGNNAIFAECARKFPDGHVAVSAIEHPCVMEAAQRHFPDRVAVIPVDANGIINLIELATELAKGDLCLVSVMAANNETGVIQPWREALKLCLKAGVYFHTDAAQHIGKRPAKGLGDCDFVTGCGHKFGAPRGTGFLKIPADFEAFNGLPGGGQEHGHRSGTENYPGLAAMLAALRFREHRMEAAASAWAIHRSIFETELARQIPGLVVLGMDADRLSNTSCMVMPDFPGSRWVARLDKHGVCISTGSACASGKTGASHVLRAMGIDADTAQRSIRISAPWDATPEQWRSLTDRITRAYAEMKAGTGAGSSTTVIRI